MRLYDRLYRHGLSISERWPDHNAMLSSLSGMRSAVLVQADDVAAQWVQASPITDTKTARIMASPYEHLWVEAMIPPVPNDQPVRRDRLEFSVCEGWRIGCFIHSIDLDDPENTVTVDELPRVFGDRTPTVRPRWMSSFFYFVESIPSGATYPLSGPLAVSCGLVDGNGHLCRNQDGEPLSRGRLSLRHDSKSADFIETLVGSIARFTAHVVHLMNCKNIDMSDEREHRHVRRQRMRDGLAAVKFKTLTINPAMTPSRQGAGGVGIGEMPLHLVRGHFATYSDDKPLFGKYTGTFWRPAHVRGSAEVGMVGKDYAVKAPRE